MRPEERGVKTHDTIAPVPSTTFPREASAKRGSCKSDRVRDVTCAAGWSHKKPERLAEGQQGEEAGGRALQSEQKPGVKKGQARLQNTGPEHGYCNTEWRRALGSLCGDVRGEPGGSGDGWITAVFSLLLSSCLSCHVLMAQRVKLKQERRMIFPAGSPFLPLLHRRVWISSKGVSGFQPDRRVCELACLCPWGLLNSSLSRTAPASLCRRAAWAVAAGAPWHFSPECGYQLMAVSCDRIWETLSPVQWGHFHKNGQAWALLDKL